MQGLSPREVYAFFLYRQLWYVRKSVDDHSVLELKERIAGTKKYRTPPVDPNERTVVITKRYGISPPVMALTRMKEYINSQQWINFTDACASQNYVRVISTAKRGSPKGKVHTALGPRESWYEDDAYEFVVFEDATRNYSMFQHFLKDTFIVGLEFCGYAHQKEKDAPKWLGMFVSPDPRYESLRQYKFTLQDE